jgi:ketose-bisphosphate aldolase
MPVVPMREILDRAFAERYGVAAINVVDDLSLEAVLAAATDLQAPLIVQTSLKTVKAIGAKPFYAFWRARADDVPVPVTLHLDHCPDREVISACLAKGWNSVLFDASALPVAENQRQTLEVVAEAHAAGAHVEGEIEAITGVEDDHGSDEAGVRQSLDVSLEFIRTTGVDVFAPAIGNAHGFYAAVPVALHGGSGMTDGQFADLIARGCAKVNISTALKVAYMRSNLAFLEDASARNVWDPPSLFRHVRSAVIDLVAGLIGRFGSAGKAW